MASHPKEIVYLCPGPPNLSVYRPDNNILIQ
jgi:hypothetical protein